MRAICACSRTSDLSLDDALRAVENPRPPVERGPLMLLLRHASAGVRHEAPADDRARRLDRVGRADARALTSALGAHAIERVVSSPHVRCLETVAPLARNRGLEVETCGELAPESSRAATLRLLASLPENVLVCTHREVFERLFGGDVTCEKGGTWIAERGTRRRAPKVVAYLPPRSGGVRPAPAARRASAGSLPAGS
jgi:phosphohistidine phosphatase SixA